MHTCCLPVCLSACPSVCLSVRLSVCLSVRLSVLLSFFFSSSSLVALAILKCQSRRTNCAPQIGQWCSGRGREEGVNWTRFGGRERERGLVRLGSLVERHQLAPAERDLGRMPQGVKRKLARLIRADDHEYHTYLLPRVSCTLHILFKVNRPPSNFDLLPHHTQLTSQFHINILHLTYLQ